MKQTKNKNTPEYIHELKEKAFEHLRHLEDSPGVPFHSIPTMAFRASAMDEEDKEGKQEKHLSTLVHKKGDMED